MYSFLYEHLLGAFSQDNTNTNDDDNNNNKEDF